MDANRSAWWLGLVAALCCASAFAAAEEDGNGSSSSGPIGMATVARSGDAFQLRIGAALVQVSDQPILGARSVGVPNTSAILALWQQETGRGRQDYYAISIDGVTFSAPRTTSYEIKLRNGAFEPGKNAPPNFGLPGAADAGTLWIVQFETPPLEAFRQQLRSMGAAIYNYLPRHAYIVRISEAVRPQVERLPYVRWIGRYHSGYRLEPWLLQGLEGVHALSQLQRYNIQVFERGPAQKNVVADRITALGGTINRLRPGSFLLQATLTPDQLWSVVKMDEVLFVDRWFPPGSDMDIVRATGGADYVASIAGYDGEGVRGEVMDGNVLATHPDFASRPIIFHGPHSGVADHGTATTGIVFGDGASDPMATGMLPAGQAIFADYDLLSDRYSHTQELLGAPYFAVFQSNSWGGGLTTAYTTVSSEMDDIVFDLDLLVCQSQSNTGTQDARPEAWAKNVVSVGGIIHNDTPTMADDGWFGAASIGPAEDGRIKPDLSHFYDAIFCAADEGGHIDFGGTSASTPIVAGHFGLMFQMWANGLFGNTVGGGSVFDERPHAATAKAIMINTARQYPFSGSGDDLTRTHQGWGVPDVGRLYDLRDNMLVVDETDAIEAFDVAHYTRVINPGMPHHEVLKATLVYSDPPGTTSSTLHRVNDLSLTVTSPTGVVYHGNNGLYEGSLSVPGAAADDINTVENVFIYNPQQGIWSIDVSADEINQDGRVETGTTDADFALVVSGGETCPLADFQTQPQGAFACIGDNVALSAQVIGADSLQWYRDGAPLTGETGTTLSLTALAPSDFGEYMLAATNDCGMRTSSPANLMDPGVPTITTDPAPVLERCAGEAASFQVTASAVGPISYQWYKDGVPIAGATDAAIEFQSASPGDAGDYWCEASTLCDTVLSQTGTLVVSGEAFLNQPASQCAETGGVILLSAPTTDAQGGPVTRRWYHDGNGVANAPPRITGAGTDTLTIINVTAADAGVYTSSIVTFDPELCINNSDPATVAVDSCAMCELLTGDGDDDGDVDLKDIQALQQCVGPGKALLAQCACLNFDDGDLDITSDDWAALAVTVTGPR